MIVVVGIGDWAQSPKPKPPNPKPKILKNYKFSVKKI
jgi:hypothetical protein